MLIIKRVWYFTPTEAAAISVLYVNTLGMFFYHKISLPSLFNILVKSAISSGEVMIMVSTAYFFGYALSRERVATELATYLIELDLPLWLLLLAINLFLLLVGMFLDISPAIIILAPILAPTLVNLELHPIQAGVIIVLNLVIGLSTPPVGVCLFVASTIGKIPLEKVYKASIPFTLASRVTFSYLSTVYYNFFTFHIWSVEIIKNILLRT